MPLKESSPTAVNVCKPVSEPPSLPSKSYSKKLDMNGTSHQNGNSLSHSVGIFPQSNMEKKVAEIVLKPPEQASRGINSLSFGKSPMDYSGKLKQIGSSPTMDEGVEVDKQKNQGEVQNMNEKAKRTPVTVPPRGINFLSFGKAPLNDSSVKELAGSPSNREDGNKILPLGDSNKYKQVGSSSARDGNINVSSQLNQSATETIHKLNEMSNGRQPAAAPPGINFLSFGKAPLDDLSSKRQSKSPSQSNNVIEIPIQERQRASSGFQNSSAVPWGLPASPITSVSDQLVHGHNKDTSSSAQKALLSTLAFAAKYESALKIDRSIVAPSVSMEANKEIRNLQSQVIFKCISAITTADQCHGSMNKVTEKQLYKVQLASLRWMSAFYAFTLQKLSPENPLPTMRPLAVEERRRRLHGMVGGRGKSRAGELWETSSKFLMSMMMKKAFAVRWFYASIKPNTIFFRGGAAVLHPFSGLQVEDS
ncbi:hypothetical protein CK203_013645 [Vitis vinifera]|uniref:Uncharacterized protein n=1 Tax=Vitis vinifera TaxID=29760 RepID=A0A438J914_VITVI|nr:hypothetical protein CK203_013645 [Vitis vinifera]